MNLSRALFLVVVALPQLLFAQTNRVWAADWISPAGGTSNEWMIFRKRVTLSSVASSVPARIAADTKYWLYVNGALVVFEGGMRGGPSTKGGIYYDQLDLAPYLRAGDNTLALLVWHYGKNGYGHRSRGANAGALLFEADSMGAAPLVSDASWRARIHPGYINDRTGSQPNERLAESNVYFDAQRSTSVDGWQLESFDDSSWPAAQDRGAAGVLPWGTPEPRPIPQLRFDDVASYTTTASTTSGGQQTITGSLRTNLQITPYIRVNAPAGAVIAIRTDRYMDGKQPSVRSTYVTRGGIQEFESLGWMSGTAVIYEMPTSVQVLSVGYRESGYATEFAGTFTSSDPFFDSLWQKAARTVYVNMRDSYMDCPTRERAQWPADAISELRAGSYAFDPASYALGSKLIREVGRWRLATGELYGPVPSGLPIPEIPQQMLATVWGSWQYYLTSGDSTWMRDDYEPLRDEVNLWGPPVDSTAFVPHRTGNWDWADWGDNIDVRLMENAWYMLAAQAVANMAHTIGRFDEEEYWRRRLDRMSGAFEQLWDSRRGAYRWPTYTGPTDERGNALLVLAGVVPATHVSQLSQTLYAQRNASPYLEFYVLEALYRLKAPVAAMQRMRERYALQMNGPDAGPTLWEFWKAAEGTTNHGWNSGPLYVLSAYAAGVRPIEPGYARYAVEPQLGSLSRVRADVPTIRGTIGIDAIALDRQRERIDLQSPDGTVARITVPWTASGNTVVSINGTDVFRGGHEAGKVAGVTFAGTTAATVSFDVSAGSWSVLATGIVSPAPRPPYTGDSTVFRRPPIGPIPPRPTLPPIGGAR